MYEKGARIFSMTWNEENEFASGCFNMKAALRRMAIIAIDKLNKNFEWHLMYRISMRKGFWDAAKALYEHPIFAPRILAFMTYVHNPTQFEKRSDYGI